MRQRAKILIVDDEPFNIDYLEQELEDFGYDTISATNGQEALEKVASENPDLILLDVMMPLMDGFTVCRTLKENDATRLIPIVMMTALGSVEDRVKGIEAGADDFLTKPVDERELRARLQTTLRLKATMDQRLGELRRIKDHFAKFVPEAVKRLVAANPEAPELAKRERDVTVLFLDISGYTRLSERLAPERLNTLVERYFSAFLDRIHQAGGDINETAGDGFMAIFQDPAHAITAVDTALALMAITTALNADNTGQSLTVHMGVNSGTALVGSTCFEGLHGTRWTFTASGPVTNLAARLAELAKPGDILIGPETARRLGDRFPLQRLAPEHLKNIAAPVEAYCLDGPRHIQI